ncbi:unnamed protein product [Closterium sp. NIES-53]
MPARELSSVSKSGTPGQLGRRGLTGVRLLLALATTKASTLRGCTSTSTTAAATSTTAAAASTTSTTTTEAPTLGYHPHHHRHPIRLLHLLHRLPCRPLHHPFSPCPSCCGVSH